jgi:hypothetical protein
MSSSRSTQRGQRFLRARPGAKPECVDADAVCIGSRPLFTALQPSGPGGRAWMAEGAGVARERRRCARHHIPIRAYPVPFIAAQNQGSTTLTNVPEIAGYACTDNYTCSNGVVTVPLGGIS